MTPFTADRLIVMCLDAGFVDADEYDEWPVDPHDWELADRYNESIFVEAHKRAV